MVRRQLSDAEVLRAAQSGDREALGIVLHEQYDRVLLVCVRMVHQRPAAEDCAQETMIRIARGIAGFDGRSALSTWCHRIAVTTALDHLRRERRRPALTTIRDDASVDDGPIDHDAERSIVHAVEAAEVRGEIAAALAVLPPEFARAVLMRDVADLDYVEIAELEGIAVGTVKSRISRGRALLNQHLGGNQSGTEGRPNTLGTNVEPG
jgi:RNA polymerase sigma-70 factor (ECF subfamily)